MVELCIPVIDLTGFKGAGREKVREEIVKACSEWGFFQLVNHGVDIALMKRIEQLYLDFFHSPVEEKMKYLISAGMEGWKHPTLTKGAHHMRGIVTKESAEFVDSVWVPDLPQHREKIPANLVETVDEYVKQCRDLQEELMRLMAEGLGLDSEAFLKRILPPMIRTKGNYYPLEGEGITVGAVQPHSDASAVTLLLSDMASGLQVERDGKWIQVEPRPEGFIVNVGDVIEILSNGRYRSVLHRGLPNSSVERLSVACFYLANRESFLEPVRELVDEHHPRVYNGIQFQDYFRSYLTNANQQKVGLADLKLQKAV